MNHELITECTDRSVVIYFIIVIWAQKKFQPVADAAAIKIQYKKIQQMAGSCIVKEYVITTIIVVVDSFVSYVDLVDFFFICAFAA